MLAPSSSWRISGRVRLVEAPDCVFLALMYCIRGVWAFKPRQACLVGQV